MPHTDEYSDYFRRLYAEVKVHINFADADEKHRFYFFFSRSYRDKLRKQMYNAVGGVCPECKQHMRLDNRNSKLFATFDHIVAQANGGTHALSNLRLLCSICNGEKSDAPVGQKKWQQRSRSRLTAASSNRRKAEAVRVAFSQMRVYSRVLRIYMPSHQEVRNEMERDPGRFWDCIKANQARARYLGNKLKSDSAESVTN